MQNRNYRALLLGVFFIAVMVGTHETLAIYMATYFWELSDQQIGWLILANLFGYAIGFVTADQLLALGVVDGPFAMVWGLVSVIFYAGYRIGRHRHREIRERLMNTTTRRRQIALDKAVRRGECRVVLGCGPH